MEFTEQINYSKYAKKNKISNFLYLFAYYMISVILLFSGIIKIIDPLPLLETLKLLPFVPKNFQILVSTVLPVVEIGLAFLMLLKMKPKLTLAFITMLFAFFLAFSIYGTVGGYEYDCGCSRDFIKS